MQDSIISWFSVELFFLMVFFSAERFSVRIFNNQPFLEHPILHRLQYSIPDCIGYSIQWGYYLGAHSSIPSARDFLQTRLWYFVHSPGMFDVPVFLDDLRCVIETSESSSCLTSDEAFEDVTLETLRFFRTSITFFRVSASKANHSAG